ncbi:MAG: SDR family NAD(P)-dependent oxidoreductase [Coriobacteriales bacterium]
MDTEAQHLRKRVAIVTGASSGLGLEFARQIDRLQQVDEIWLVARKADALDDVAKQLDTPAVPVVADLTSKADIAAIKQRLADFDPDVRYLVNAAGFGKFGDWQTISDEAVDSMIDLNCRGLVDMTHATLPYMSRGAHIVQVASAAAFVPLPHMNVYAATKAFVLRYTRALRWELHGTGITATALCPTWVKTGFEKVARESGGGHDVRHLLGAQKASTVVSRALTANKLHLAVATASPQSCALRLIGKVVPSCITMAGWDIIRRI